MTPLGRQDGGKQKPQTTPHLVEAILGAGLGTDKKEATMITKKQITETYKGKRFDENDKFSTITTIAFHENYAVLMSGSYSPNEAGYYVEACIDRNTGENVIDGARPCDSKEDAIDVAYEMMG